MKVKPAREIRSAEVATLPAPAPFPGSDMPPSDYHNLQSSDEDIQDTWDIFAGLRALFEPPITGQGLTVVRLGKSENSQQPALIEAMEYIRQFLGKIVVVKLGGSILDDMALQARDRMHSTCKEAASIALKAKVKKKWQNQDLFEV